MSKEKQIKLYRDDPDFKDLKPVPLPQTKGDPFFINYSAEIVDLFGYFFALLEKDEISERGIKVAERIIEKFTSHYTAWWYKYHILETLPYDFKRETEFINKILVENPKSYQAWHYMQWLVDKSPEFHDQIPFLKSTFIIDEKNFHAWSFSIWYAERWNQYNEVYLLALHQIKIDMRNNSAWNTRRTIGEKLNVDIEKEFNDVEDSLLQIGKNESACNFAMSLVDKKVELKDRLKSLANKMIEMKPDNFYAYRLLLYVANIDNDTSEIHHICDELIKLDTIRAPYYSLLKTGKIKFQ